MNKALYGSWTSCTSEIKIDDRIEHKQPLITLGDIVILNIANSKKQFYVVCCITPEKKIGVTNLQYTHKYGSILQNQSNFVVVNEQFFIINDNNNNNNNNKIPIHLNENPNNNEKDFINKLKLTWIGPYQIDIDLYGKYDNETIKNPYEFFSMPNLKMAYKSHNFWYNKLCTYHSVPIIQYILSSTILSKDEYKNNDNDSTYPFAHSARFIKSISKIKVQILILITSFTPIQLFYELNQYMNPTTILKQNHTPIFNIKPKVAISNNNNNNNNNLNSILYPHQLHTIEFMNNKENNDDDILSSLYYKENAYHKKLYCTDVLYQPVLNSVIIQNQLPKYKGGIIAYEHNLGKKFTIMHYLLNTIHNNNKTLFIINDNNILSWKDACYKVLPSINVDFDHKWKKDEKEKDISNNNNNNNNIVFITKQYILTNMNHSEHIYLFSTIKWHRVIFEDGFLLKPFTALFKIVNLIPDTVIKWSLISNIKSIKQWEEWIGQLAWLKIIDINDTERFKYFQNFMHCIITNNYKLISNNNNNNPYSFNQDYTSFDTLSPFNKYMYNEMILFWEKFFNSNVLYYDQENLKNIIITIPTVNIIYVPLEEKNEKKYYSVLYEFYKLKYHEYKTKHKRNNNLKRNDTDIMIPKEILNNIFKFINGSMSVNILQIETNQQIHTSIENYIINPDDIHKKYYSEFEFKIFIDECAICLNTLDLPLITACGHPFCKDCILQYIRYNMMQIAETRCPFCKKIIQDLYRPNNNIIKTNIVKKKIKKQQQQQQRAEVKDEVEEESDNKKMELVDLNHDDTETIINDTSNFIQFSSKTDYIVKYLIHENEIKKAGNNNNKIIVMSNYNTVLKTLYDQLSRYDDNNKFMKSSLIYKSPTFKSFANQNITYLLEEFMNNNNKGSYLFWCMRNGEIPKSILHNKNISEVWFLDPFTNPEIYVAWMEQLKCSFINHTIHIKHFIYKDTAETNIMNWYSTYANDWVNDNNKNISFKITYNCPTNLLDDLFTI